MHIIKRSFEPFKKRAFGKSALRLLATFSSFSTLSPSLDLDPPVDPSFAP